LPAITLIPDEKRSGKPSAVFMNIAPHLAAAVGFRAHSQRALQDSKDAGIFISDRAVAQTKSAVLQRHSRSFAVQRFR
jgi:hypothetical protein